MDQISVNNTVYFQDIYENTRHAANFRGWNGDNAIIIWNGIQMQIEKERIFQKEKHLKGE